MNNLEKYIELGGCSKPHGIKGAFSFHLHNSEESVLQKGSRILLTPGDGSKISKDGEEFTIKSIAFGNKIIVYLDEVNDRNQVESMLPFTIYFKKSELPPTEEGEFYLEDLVGLTVINDKTEREVGRISSHYDNTAQIILVVRGKMNFEVPFIDHFVKEVDLEEKKIRIVVPEMID